MTNHNCFPPPSAVILHALPGSPTPQTMSVIYVREPISCSGAMTIGPMIRASGTSNSLVKLFTFTLADRRPRPVLSLSERLDADLAGSCYNKDSFSASSTREGGGPPTWVRFRDLVHLTCSTFNVHQSLSSQAVGSPLAKVSQVFCHWVGGSDNRG